MSEKRKGNNGYTIPTQMLFHVCNDKSHITTIQLDTANVNAATGFDHIRSKIIDNGKGTGGCGLQLLLHPLT